MAGAPSETDATQPDVGDVSVTLVTEGVERKITVSVSPRPLDPEGWAKVVQAMWDFVREHPERFS